MMRLQATSATTPTVPATQPVQTAKPSFRGNEDDLCNVFMENKHELKEPKVQTAEDRWTKNKKDFEELSNDSSNPGFIRKVGKTGVMLATGVLAYGGAKLGMRKSLEMFSSMLKSAPVQKVKTAVSGFVTNTVVPDAKSVLNSVKNLSTTKKVTQKVKDAYAFVSKHVKENAVTKFVKKQCDSLGKKYTSLLKGTSVSQKRKIVTCKNAYSKAKAKTAGFAGSIKSKIPTLTQVKTYLIETLAIGSAFAGAMTAAGARSKEN